MTKFSLRVACLFNVIEEHLSKPSFTHLFMSIYYMRGWNKMNLQLIARGF